MNNYIGYIYLYICFKISKMTRIVNKNKKWFENISECGYLLLTSSTVVFIALLLEFGFYLAQFLLYVEHNLKTILCYPAQFGTTAVPPHPTMAADCNLTNGRAAAALKGNHNNSEESKK